MSDREFKVWEWYFNTRLNRPGLTDHHLMQIGSLVATFLCREAVSMDDMRLSFTAEEEPSVDEMTEEEMMERAREVSEARRQLLIAQLDKKAKSNGGGS